MLELAKSTGPDRSLGVRIELPSSTASVLRLAAVLLVVLLAGSLLVADRSPRSSATVTVVARGLEAPRGLAVGPDGLVYVAEVGTESTGGRISRILRDGRRETVVDGLPRAHFLGDEDVGPSGLAFRNGVLHFVVGEAPGPLGGALDRWDASTGRVERVADFVDYQRGHDPSHSDPESNPFALLYDANADVFLVVDSSGNDVVSVQPSGEIDPVAAWSSDPVPTGLARGPDGALFVALFSPYDYPAGSGRLDRIASDGHVETFAHGLTTPIGVAFSPDGTLYLLEFSAGGLPNPWRSFGDDSGRLLRIVNGRSEVVIDHLPYPTAILAETDGALLVSVHGALSAPGTGEIWRIVPGR
jgi:hypothetical protein